MLERMTGWARRIKTDVVALYIAARDPRTPWGAKAMAAAVAAYALSPIDLIPDFIPILGYLDDLVLLPVGIYLILKLVPAPVLRESRAEAETWIAQRRPLPKSIGAAVVIMLLWVVLFWALWKYWGDDVTRWLGAA